MQNSSHGGTAASRSGSLLRGGTQCPAPLPSQQPSAFLLLLFGGVTDHATNAWEAVGMHGVDLVQGWDLEKNIQQKKTLQEYAGLGWCPAATPGT